MERSGPIDVEKLVATSSRPHVPAPRPTRFDWRAKVILILVGVIVCGAVLQVVHQRQAAQVEAQRAKAEQAQQEEAVAEVRRGQLATRLEEVQACNSEPRLGEPEAVLVAYAECHGARIQETRTLAYGPRGPAAASRRDRRWELDGRGRHHHQPALERRARVPRAFSATRSRKRAWLIWKRSWVPSAIFSTSSWASTS